MIWLGKTGLFMVRRISLSGTGYLRPFQQSFVSLIFEFYFLSVGYVREMKIMKNNKILMLALAASMTLGLSACATNGGVNDEAVYVGGEQISDPMEGLNRGVFA